MSLRLYIQRLNIVQRVVALAQLGRAVCSDVLGLNLIKKLLVTDPQEIQYIRNLIQIDIRNIESNLNAKQKLLQKFQDKDEPTWDLISMRIDYVSLVVPLK